MKNVGELIRLIELSDGAQGYIRLNQSCRCQKLHTSTLEHAPPLASCYEMPGPHRPLVCGVDSGPVEARVVVVLALGLGLGLAGGGVGTGGGGGGRSCRATGRRWML